MMIKNTFLAFLALILLTVSCDEANFDDADILAELDSLKSLGALTSAQLDSLRDASNLTSEQLDSLKSANAGILDSLLAVNDALDSLGKVASNLQDSIENLDGYFGPIAMTATGTREDDEPFSISKEYSLLSGEKYEYAYVEDNGDDTYYIYVQLYAGSAGGDSDAWFEFDYDTNETDNFGISDFQSYSDGYFVQDDLNASWYFDQTGYWNEIALPPARVLAPIVSKNNVTINGFSFNTSSLDLSIDFTVKDTESITFNSTNNASEVNYTFEGQLAWDSVCLDCD